MIKPLAIDLFCGSLQAKFFLRANVAIKELMTGRAENPDHMSLCVGNEFPRAVSLELRFVGDLKDSVLAGSVEGCREVRASAPETPKDGILKRAPGIVYLAHARMAARKLSSVGSRRLFGALSGTVPRVRAGWRDLEMCSAGKAFSSRLNNIHLLPAPPPTSARGAWLRTISLVWSDRPKLNSTVYTKQIVHEDAMP